MLRLRTAIVLLMFRPLHNGLSEGGHVPYKFGTAGDLALLDKGGGVHLFSLHSLLPCSTWPCLVTQHRPTGCLYLLCVYCRPIPDPSPRPMPCSVTISVLKNLQF